MAPAELGWRKLAEQAAALLEAASLRSSRKTDGQAAFWARLTHTVGPVMISRVPPGTTPMLRDTPFILLGSPDQQTVLEVRPATPAELALAQRTETLRGDETTVSLAIGRPVVDEIDKLRDTGLWGPTREKVVEELMRAGLRAAVGSR